MPHYAGLNPRSWRLYKPAVHPRFSPGLYVLPGQQQRESEKATERARAQRERSKERARARASEIAIVSGRKGRGRTREGGRVRENAREKQSYLPGPILKGMNRGMNNVPGGRWHYNGS